MLYIYIDETGDLGFNAKGSRYLILTAVSSLRPFWWYPSLPELKHDIMCGPPPVELEYFHACKDSPPVKSRFLTLISNNLLSARFDAIVVEKRKAHPKVQQLTRFYPEHLSYLVKYVVNGWTFGHTFHETILIADNVPFSGQKQKIVEHATKSALKSMLHGSAYRVYFHSSAAHGGLQVADYVAWALRRKWELGDMIPYGAICGGLKSEFDVYQTGNNYYY